MGISKINFEKVKNEAPKAFDALLNWFSLSHSISVSLCEDALLENEGVSLSNRRLSEFFDSHTVSISIIGIKKDEQLRFKFKVEEFESSFDYTSRLECEFNAFMKAFYWMDENIKTHE